ncbi:FecR family protein [Desertivirga xinjiangensis]|uniref:FecR family protein n=1 Tax=Desertivirga xinjiangensis TaxID=539206 RepID=UPI00210E802A|nr:FecR domain-containing protein [Pedobacter xinjiangensis]
MAKKNIFAERRKAELQAEAWFHRTDDSVPFEAFSNQQEKTRTGEEILYGIRRKIKIQKLYKSWLKVAAAAVLLLTAGTISYRVYERSTSPVIGKTWDSYTAGKGEFKKITLPDSTVVHLRPGSKVSVSKPFLQQTRRVELQQGEAYFEVSHDPKHPFTVTTGKIMTEVLGTKFIINNDPLAADIRVALLSGKVAVRTAKTQLGILSPNQQLSFNRINETAKLESATAYSAENWLNGEYILENVPLRSFAKTFNNVFLMEVKFGQKALEDLPISIQFSLADSPGAILDQLKLIHGLHYQINDKEVILMR